MKALIIGCGNTGSALAEHWHRAGLLVTGTTTTESKLASLQPITSRTLLLRGGDRKAVAAAVQDQDMVVVSVAPPVARARTPEERQATYEDVLVRTCRHAAAAATGRLIFLSSFSVYGDGGPGDEPVSESTPLTDSADASPRCYQLAEEAVLAAGGCVLRLPDIYGAPGDMSFRDRVDFGIRHMHGKVPFSANAPLYRIHYKDVVEAVDHAAQHQLTGPWNVCVEGPTPPTNAAVFNGICDREGWPRLEFLGQIRAPERRISSARLHGTGYRIRHTNETAWH